ncbi:hypothetical protein [Dactylosporangium sp. NPDC005555]
MKRALTAGLLAAAAIHAALPQLIGWSRDRGLRLGTVAEHQAVPR